MSQETETLDKSVSSSVNSAMDTLTAQWYNAMVTGLGLDPNQFQLYQGPNSLMSTSQDMWNVFNAVPPKSVNNYYNPNQSNNFSSAYNLILEALVPASNSSFQNCMGDYYGKWSAYFENNDPKEWTAQGVSDLFNSWAMRNAPGKAGCVTGLTNTYINPINIAVNKFASAGGKYAWNKTADQLKSALAGGAQKSFTLDSQTTSSDVKHTWAGGNTSVFFDIFSFGGGGKYDKLTTKTTSAGVKIDANFQKVTTFTAGPLAVNDPNDPILAEFKAWYESAALAKAYTTKDNTVWNNQSSTTWDKAFGPEGFLQRLTSSLIVADGVTITMTSNASYDTSERTEIEAAAKAGIWPFFSVSGKGGTTTEVKFNDQGNFTITTKIALGNPQVLGVLQSPMSAIFS
ncbi:hypothetical protein [Photobacterium satsumensis]|uniref:hypothetical protein n=1 Tax=Photobacterium satsumensis TaxID=2910239 RepID=UPI003D0EAF02